MVPGGVDNGGWVVAEWVDDGAWVGCVGSMRER